MTRFIDRKPWLRQWFLVAASFAALACSESSTDVEHASVGGSPSNGGAKTTSGDGRGVETGGAIATIGGGTSTTTGLPTTGGANTTLNEGGANAGGSESTTTNALSLAGATMAGGTATGEGGTVSSTGGTNMVVGGTSGSSGSMGSLDMAGASGHIGIGGVPVVAGAAGTGGTGTGGSVSVPPCVGPNYSSDCSKVPYFQCGTTLTCDGATLKVQWHEHVMCATAGSTANTDKIFNYSCTFPCDETACKSVGSWPASGTVVAQACQTPKA